MPTFLRRSTQPMTPESYRAAARRLRRMADDLEALADAPAGQSRIAAALAGLLHYVRHLVQRQRLT